MRRLISNGKYSKNIYLLSHEEMVNECCMLAGYAHGIKESIELDNSRELSIHLNFECSNIELKRWNDSYLVESFEVVKTLIEGNTFE